MSLRTRIAPTPSGFLHPGNGASFVLAWVVARATKGRVLLRIDDLDRARFRMEYLEDIFFTLDWLGLDYDEGPGSPQDFLDRFSQSLRTDTYHEALRQLAEQGVLYACDCSRKHIREQSVGSLYSGFCRQRKLYLDTPHTAWRIRLPDDCEVAFSEWKQDVPVSLNLPACMGDFVLRQKDGSPAYQIASLCDDLLWHINFIVRGQDLLPSTGAQMFLAQQLGYEDFQKATFFHHALLTDDSGEKLSKSAGSTALKSWREAGKNPDDVWRQAAQWLGLEYRGETPMEMAAMLSSGAKINAHFL
ncbi:MAG TPA: glutamate--tRNA ligase family protein [Saprospiraceae bacterium]|nr:glutamate--tRNA ligase family protein [Saprospiraceae bacterium]